MVLSILLKQNRMLSTFLQMVDFQFLSLMKLISSVGLMNLLNTFISISPLSCFALFCKRFHDFILLIKKFRNGFSLCEKLDQNEKCDLDVYTALIKRLEVYISDKIF